MIANGQLRRSQDQRMIAGVCGGLAERLGWDARLVRVLYVLASMLTGTFPGIVAYVVLWAVLPEREPQPLDLRAGATPAQDMATEPMKPSETSDEPQRISGRGLPWRATLVTAAILGMVGLGAGLYATPVAEDESVRYNREVRVEDAYRQVFQDIRRRSTSGRSSDSHYQGLSPDQLQCAAERAVRAWVADQRGDSRSAYYYSAVRRCRQEVSGDASSS